MNFHHICDGTSAMVAKAIFAVSAPHFPLHNPSGNLFFCRVMDLFP